MDGREALRHVAAKSGKSRTVISVGLGRSRNYFSSLITQGAEPTVKVFAKIAKGCGYRLVLIGHGEMVTIDGEAEDPN